jgi:polygalacturonase
LFNKSFLNSRASETMARLATTVIALSCLLAAVSGHKGDDKGSHGGKIRPGDASSIQAALDAAAPGSTVTIPAGLYIVREPLIVRNNDITIYAKNGNRPATPAGLSH